MQDVCIHLLSSNATTPTVSLCVPSLLSETRHNTHIVHCTQDMCVEITLQVKCFAAAAHPPPAKQKPPAAAAERPPGPHDTNSMFIGISTAAALEGCDISFKQCTHLPTTFVWTTSRACRRRVGALQSVHILAGSPTVISSGHSKDGRMATFSVFPRILGASLINFDLNLFWIYSNSLL